MRRILFGGIAVLGTAAFLLFTLGSSNGPSGRTYRIELDNAYDLVKGGEFKVAGVNAGATSSLDADPKTLQPALRRPDPALPETDTRVALLARDAQTINQLNVNANSVMGALARNNQKAKTFIVEAKRASAASATQARNITATWQRLPA